MPTYEYACRDCGRHLEVVQSFKDDPLTVCPTCDGSLRKVFGTIGIAFKGSGFYKTDSRSSSGSSTKKADAASSSGGDSSASTSSSGDSGGSSSSSSSGSSSSGTDGGSSTKPAAAAS